MFQSPDAGECGTAKDLNNCAIRASVYQVKHKGYAPKDDDASACKGEAGEDEESWSKDQEGLKDCKWAKQNDKCHKEGTNGNGETRTGYESCCKSCPQ